MICTHLPAFGEITSMFSARRMVRLRPSRRNSENCLIIFRRSGDSGN
jgi:hypothetical protein